MPVILSRQIFRVRGEKAAPAPQEQAASNPEWLEWKDVGAVIIAQLSILLPIVVGFILAMGAVIWLILKLWGV